ncbi:MAG: hypothetical protein JOZ29_21605, partial [Deltaproteobacteria bacterium]|nr:hypothetical protein [Deltaproteobacteria bacterium]
VRIVNLKNKTGLHDRPVFLAHRFGYRCEIALVISIIFILKPMLDRAWSDGSDKRFGRTDSRQGCLEIANIGLNSRPVL